ncbi:zinc-finger-containing protein [Roseicella sp. DB1501]|uniref:zinc-finger-containing protein n=1 Tax=Roseicella sp. DB1501 TaxID=2730925 RepID=UPI001491EEE9|nr:zinc-finger-containing protein [Roseicella sp. DB1501]NOG70455.1 hypothetical protein [Roseicella sp. DB1501]
MKLYCCECTADVEARLTDGREIYPHRPDLGSLPFWKCDTCHNHVGCHHKTANRTRPLGCIPSPAMRQARSRIHAVLDPLWKSGRVRRKAVYAQLSTLLGREYHTGELRTLEEAERVLEAVRGMGQVQP